MTEVPPAALKLRGGPLVRRALPLFWRVRRGMTLGVRAIVLDSDRVLLVRHGYWEGWHFPGGGVEPGETARMALERELMEETGCRVGAEPILHGLYFNPMVGGRDHVAVFVVRDFTQGAVPPPNMEIAEARFFPLASLPADVSAPTRRRLGEILDGEPRDHLW